MTSASPGTNNLGVDSIVDETFELTDEKRAALQLALRPRMNAYIAHAPTARQQAALLLNSKKELLYGGAAGGGKSDWLLMCALQYVDVPGYAALLMRRTFSQLSKAGGLLIRAQEWLSGTDAHGTDTVGGVPTRWLFPSGARLEFGHCQYEANKYDYQSAEYQFIGFDELTQFPDAIYLYLMSRLRRLATSKIPLRVRSASNPGNIGHEWVRSRFVYGSNSARVFIRAMLKDNPYLDRAEYEETLSELHPYERQQLLDGDWDIKPPGSKFKREWFQIVNEIPSDITRWVRYWDLAATEKNKLNSKKNDPDYTAGSKMGRTPRKQFVIPDIQAFRATPLGVKDRIKQTAELDGRDTSIVIEQEPGASGKFVIDDFVRELAGFQARGNRATGDKFVRMGPFASQAEAGNVLLVNGPWVEPFLRECEMIDGSGNTHDDRTDSCSGALKELTTHGTRRIGIR